MFFPCTVLVGWVVVGACCMSEADSGSEEENWIAVDQKQLCGGGGGGEEENWSEVDQRRLSGGGVGEEENWLAIQVSEVVGRDASQGFVRSLTPGGSVAASSSRDHDGGRVQMWGRPTTKTAALHTLAQRLLTHSCPEGRVTRAAAPLQTLRCLAADVGLSEKYVASALHYIAEAVFRSSLKPSLFVKAAISWSKSDRAQRVTVLVTARAKKWDSTKIGRLKSKTKKYVHAGIERKANVIDGPQEVSVMTCRFGLVIRKRQVLEARHGSSDEFLILNAPTGSHLMTHDRNTAECYRSMLSIFNSDDDSYVDGVVPRSLEFDIVDEFSANLRCHKASKRDNPRRKHLLRICLCHKKANVSGHTFDCSGGFITRLTRLGLSFERSVHGDTLEAARQLVSGPKLVIIMNGRNTADADTYRENVYDLFLSQDTPYERWRGALIRGLFNGDIRRSDRIEHIETGCCKSESDTRRIMAEFGVAALFGGFKTIDRKNWTGALTSIVRPGLAFLVHRLLAQAYCFGTKLQLEDGARNAALLDLSQPLPLQDADFAGHDCADTGPASVSWTTDPSHIWKEDLKDKIGGTREWLLSDMCHDDFVLNARHQLITEKCVLNQLKIGGAKWSREQESKYLKDGVRSYRSWEAFDSLDVHKALSQTWTNLTNPTMQPIYTVKTEGQQLRLFKVFSRQGGAHYDIIRRTRKWEYKFLSATRFPRIRQALRQEPDCVLGDYVADHRSHYIGADKLFPGPLDRPLRPAQEAEIFLTLDLLEEDTTDVERWHSWNDRRAKLRSMTHAPSLESLSALYSCFHATVYSSDVHTPDNRISDHPEEMGLKEPVQGSWGYRAFQVLERRANYCGTDTDKVLGRKWRALDADARAFYEELGELAESRFLEGQNAFAPVRMPRQQGQQAPNLGSRSVSSAGVDNLIVQQANTEWQRGARRIRADKVELETIKSHVGKHSQREMPSVFQNWKVVGGSFSSQQTKSCHDRPGYYKCVAFERSQDDALVAANGALTASFQARTAYEKSWSQRHRFIRHQEQPDLGRVPSYSNDCYFAERCVHEGEGLRVSEAYSRVHRCFDLALVVVSKPKEKNFLAKLIKDNDVVLRFRWPKADIEVTTSDALSDLDYSEVWMHVSYMLLGKGAQWRPIFLMLERDPAGNRHNCIGVKLNRNSPLSNGRWKDLWEVLFDYVHCKSTSVLLQFFRLYVDQRKVVVQPWLQRVVALSDIQEFDIWQVTLPPPRESSGKRKAKAKVGSSRRVRGRGRGGRSRGRGGGLMKSI